jgi:hypothetical protein
LKYRAIQLFAAVALVFSLVGKASAQLEFLKKAFEPRIFRVTEEVRTYIRTELPPVSHNREEELHHVDLIFLKAMELSKSDIGTALLAASIAVLNRADIKPTFPILGIVTLPLPAEDSAEAIARINQLPRYIYSDSPQDKWGDSDKLVHFFGSAYLTYESGATPIPEALGKFVETGEVALKLDTAADPRDLFTNRLGQKFGRALSDGREVIPSDYLSAEFIRK